MRIVQLTRDMRPNGRAGDDIVVPDAVAESLVKNKEATNPRPFPPPDVAPPQPAKPSLPAPRRYATRKRG